MQESLCAPHSHVEVYTYLCAACEHGFSLSCSRSLSASLAASLASRRLDDLANFRRADYTFARWHFLSTIFAVSPLLCLTLVSLYMYMHFTCARTCEIRHRIFECTLRSFSFLFSSWPSLGRIGKSAVPFADVVPDG